MFRIRVTSKQGNKRAKRQVSSDLFPTMEAARGFIADSIRRQEKLCWRGWGMCATYTEENGNMTTATYKSPIIFVDALVQTFEILVA